MPRYSFRDPPTPLVSLERVLDADPPSEPRYNEGNKVWCATLPPGQYEIADEPDGENMLAVHRIGDDGERELALKLPAADYIAEDDEAGMHVHRVPEGENAASLLNGHADDAAIPNRRTAEMVTLQRLNRFHRARAWDRSNSVTTCSPLASDPTLRRLNEANRKRWGGNDAA